MLVPIAGTVNGGQSRIGLAVLAVLPVYPRLLAHVAVAGFEQLR